MKTFTAILYAKKDMYIAECPEVGTVSQGKTVEEAEAFDADLFDFMERLHQGDISRFREEGVQLLEGPDK